MKKIIAILLVAVLVSSGLGSVAYAQDPANGVELGFHTSWIYQPPGDIFTQSVEPVTGERKWFATIFETGEPVFGTGLSLTSNLPLGWFHPEPETIAPPTYQWSFGDVSKAKAGVGFAGPDPSPVDFFPGFDASRTVGPTVFTGPGTQTLTITMTPRDGTSLDMRVQAPENELVNPVITSPITDESQGIWLSPDGHDLQICPTGLELTIEWSITVTIDVTPKVPQLEYMPFVEVHLPGPGPGGSGEEIGSSSFSYEVSELGTWTWSTTGTYDWHWGDSIVREVHWGSCSRDLSNRVHAGLNTHYRYNVPGDTFENQPVEGEKSWHTGLNNWEDVSGEPVNGVTLTLQSDWEFDYMNPDPDSINPPTWSFGTVDQGSDVHADVGSSPVTFTPGFSATRIVEPTVFLQSEAPENRIQTVTITVTPAENITNEYLTINVTANDHPLVNPVITEVAAAGEVWQSEHRVRIRLTDLQAGTTHTATITIEVTPNVPKVEFIPSVDIGRVPFNPLDTIIGNSVNLTSEIGTWTWSAEGDYEWVVSANEWIGHSVAWGLSFREITEPVNEVWARFSNEWVYASPGDSFTNQDVPGNKQWVVMMNNSHDDTGEPVTALALSLTSDLEFDNVSWENLTTEGPPIYEWAFGDVPQGSDNSARVELYSPGVFTFRPGFDASRSVDITEFWQSEGTRTQTLTITVIPRDTTQGFNISVGAWENELVNPVINPPETTEQYSLSPDGHYFDIWPRELPLNEPWTITITIEVTPKRPKIEFMPMVHVKWNDHLASGTASGSSLSYPAIDPAVDPPDEVGTWKWSATGSYEWNWMEDLQRRVNFRGYSREDYLLVESQTNWNYSSPEDSFTNSEVIGNRLWGARITNRFYVTGETLASANLSLASDLAFELVNPEPVTKGPPTYEWSFPEIPVGAGEGATVSFETDPSPVTFTPGFDASRSVDKTVFTATDNQTITITVTPREAMNMFAMGIRANENEWVNPVITSCRQDGSGGDKFTFNLSPDGHVLHMWQNDPVVGTEYTYVVAIEVTPKVDKVEFLPFVDVLNLPKYSIAPGGTGSSVAYAVEGMGTWTWSTTEPYTWAIATGEPFRGVNWYPRCREMPVAQASVDPYLAPVDSDFTFDGSASSGAIVSYDWDFGDGSSGSGISVTHAYAAPGLYDVVLTVTDDRGAQSTDTVMAVVYDPAAGFATGGGWLIPGGKTSYNDDWLPNIDGTSPANFGFVVKYKKGASTPDGQLEFQYQQGDFNLHSSGMEWLVITNKNWAKFQGLATIKGLDGLYPFHVDARDGDFGGGDQPDRFIIKVYAPGADPDQSDPIYKASGDLQGGSIVIHGKGYEVTTLRLQTWLAPDNPFMTPLENFVQAVEQGTEGSVRIELYPGDALVPNWELAKAVEWGDVEMGLIPNGLLEKYSPVMDGGGLPFLYNDDDGLMAAVQAGIGDLLSGEMVAHNITAIDWTTTGFAHLLSRQMMLDDPGDITGLKIRVPGFVIRAEAISEWGGTPVLMPASEMYMALRDELIDGATFPLHAYDSFKLYEVAPYFCVDYAFAGLTGLCINSDVWNSIDENTRQIMTQAASEFVSEMLVTVKQLDAAALQRIQAYEGVEVYTLTPQKRLVWRDASRPVWERWVADVGTVGQQIIDIALAHNPLP